MQTPRISAALASTAIGAALIAATPGYASASTQQADHETFPATGIQFTCGQDVLTVTNPDATADQVMHTGLDHTGVFHFTGTLTVHDITAQDAVGNTYTITGATWFGGNGTDQQQQIYTDTEHFVIRNADGGVYGKVQIVDHFTINGNTFSFDIGGCEPPPESD